MIHTIDKRKRYTDGSRDFGQTDLEITRLKKLHFEQDAIFTPSKGTGTRLYLLESGKVLCNGTDLSGQDLICTRGYTDCVFEVAKGTCLTELVFSYSGNIPLLQKPFAVFPLSGEIKTYFSEICTTWLYYDSLPGSAEGMLLFLLDKLNLLCIASPSDRSLYRKCYTWIEQNAARYITARDAAEAMGFSAAHLNRVVKKQSGKCLGELITAKRLSYIKKLLRNTACSTETAAACSGFDSAELFRKFFRYHTGMTVKEYRQNERENLVNR